MALLKYVFIPFPKPSIKTTPIIPILAPSDIKIFLRNFSFILVRANFTALNTLRFLFFFFICRLLFNLFPFSYFSS